MTDALRSGSELGGYRIEAPLGMSATGRVYRAAERASGRPVTLEVIASRLAKDDGFRRRFHHDLGLAAALDHPHIAPVIETGETSRPGDDEPMMWVTREPLDTADLGTVIEREGPLEPGRAARLVAQAGSALEAAHRRGLLHRGLDPASVLVFGDVEGEHVYVTGFGLADDGAAGSASDIRESLYPPPPEYVAPEQIKGDVVDRQADIYALGGVLYCALTGHPPVSEGGTKEKLEAHLKGAARESSGAANSVPEELDRVIRRALAKTPQERYASADEFVGELSKAAGQEGQPVAVPAPEAAAAASGAQPEPGSPRPADKQRVIQAWRESVMSGGRMWSPSRAGQRGPASASAAAPPPAPAAEGDSGGAGENGESRQAAAGSEAKERAGTGPGTGGGAPPPDSGARQPRPADDKAETAKPAPASARPAEGMKAPAAGAAGKDRGKGAADKGERQAGKGEAGKGEREVGKGGGAAAGPGAGAGDSSAKPRKSPKEVPLVQPRKQEDKRRRATPAVIAAICLLVLGGAAAVLAGSGTFSDDSGSDSAGGEDKAAAPSGGAEEREPPAEDRGGGTPEEDRGAQAPEAERPARESRPKPAPKLSSWPNRSAYTAVIFASPSDREEATARARKAARSGYRAGVLRSDGYSTIVSGYWVAFAGVYPSASEAQAAVARLRSRDVASSPYVRLISK